MLVGKCIFIFVSSSVYLNTKTKKNISSMSLLLCLSNNLCIIQWLTYDISTVFCLLFYFQINWIVLNKNPGKWKKNCIFQIFWTKTYYKNTHNGRWIQQIAFLNPMDFSLFKNIQMIFFSWSLSYASILTSKRWARFLLSSS